MANSGLENHGGFYLFYTASAADSLMVPIHACHARRILWPWRLSEIDVFAYDLRCSITDGNDCIDDVCCWGMLAARICVFKTKANIDISCRHQECTYVTPHYSTLAINHVYFLAPRGNLLQDFIKDESQPFEDMFMAGFGVANLRHPGFFEKCPEWSTGKHHILSQLLGRAKTRCWYLWKNVFFPMWWTVNITNHTYIH